jgi:hypothetical protein
MLAVFPHAVAGLTGTAREMAIDHAYTAFSFGFSISLLTAAVFALGSSIIINRLMRSR